MKKIILTFSFLLFFISITISQNNVWDGSAGDDLWSTDANWSLNHVPLATEDVKVWAAAAVIDVDDDAFAKSVTFQGDQFTVKNGNTLIVDGSAGVGFFSQGVTEIESGGTMIINNSTNSAIRNIGAGNSFSVNGTLTIDGTTNNFGIRNETSFINNGTINIDNTANNGINHIANDVFYNLGTINIGLSGDIGAHGIYTTKTFDNQWEINIGSASGAITNNGVFVNTGGTFKNNGAFLTIDYSVMGIMNAGTFINEAGGSITMKSNNSSFVIRNNSIFENKAGCTIDFESSPNSGLYNASGDLTNGGTMNFTGTSTVVPCIDNRVQIDNSGIINIDNSAKQGILNFSGATIDNSGEIKIAQTGNIASHGIENNGTINNYWLIYIGSTAASIGSRGYIGNGSLVNDGGYVYIDNTAQQALFNNGGTISNEGAGEIHIGSLKHCSHRGIQNNGTFNNTAGSILTIEDVEFESIYLQGGIFTNDATYNHKSTVSAYSIRDGLTGGSFVNETSGVIFSKAIIGNTTGAVTAFTQKGTINPGNSPGILEFNGGLTLAGSSKYNCEINGSGGAGAGDQDQIRVTSGDTELNGTLELIFGGYTPAADEEFIILEYAGGLTGTFSTVNGLPAGWFVDYGTKVPGKVFIYGANSEIPIKLLSFNAFEENNKVTLNWQTSSENNNDYFEIQRSTDGKEFSYIGKIDGSGDSREIVRYSFEDEYPVNGMNFYRLKQVDFDGRFEYSNTISVNILGKEISIYPNPTSDFISVDNVDNWSNVTIYDVNGTNCQIPKSSNNKIDISNLPKGLYTLKVQGKKALKFIVK